jgi:uncharacterized cupredoxin-like copper-binding protein
MRALLPYKAIAVTAIAACLFLVAACGGEDRPDVDVIEDGTSSGSGTGSVSASGTGSATGEPAGPGVVEDKPADAIQVDVTLAEWAVTTSTASVAAGEIYFLVENTGPDDPHEFVVIRTDLGPTELPVVEGKVPEDEVDLLDEIEPFTPGSSASLTLSLAAGSYVLICNIAEIEDGELESHYELGMRTAFTVD